jgi:endonuclease YncB( thermonuclease family)
MESAAAATTDALLKATAAIPEFTLNGRTLPAKVVSCYDGDTFHAVIPLAEGQIWKFACRMTGYDTPEMKPPANKPGRDLEKARAMKAKQALMSHVCTGVDMSKDADKKVLGEIAAKNTKIIQLVCKEFDKYGRLLVEVPLADASGTVNDWMVKNGHGYAYDGGKKDTSFATAALAAVAVS